MWSSERTPGANVYLIEVIFDLVVGRQRGHVDPVEGEVCGRRQQVLDGHAAAVAAAGLVGQEDGPAPAVVVEHLLQGVGDAGPGAADSHDRRVDVRIVQLDVAAPLRVVGDVPVGRHEPGRRARCARREKKRASSFAGKLTEILESSNSCIF